MPSTQIKSTSTPVVPISESLSAVTRLDGFEYFAMPVEKAVRPIKEAPPVTILGLPGTQPFLLALRIRDVNLSDGYHQFPSCPSVPVEIHTTDGDRTAEVVFQSGARRMIGWEKLDEYWTDAGNPNNIKEVRTIVLMLPDTQNGAILRVAPPTADGRASYLAATNLIVAESPLIIAIPPTAIDHAKAPLLREIASFAAARTFFVMVPVESDQGIGSEIAVEVDAAVYDQLQALGFTDHNAVAIRSLTGDDESLRLIRRQIDQACQTAAETAIRHRIVSTALVTQKVLFQLRSTEEFLESLGDRPAAADIAYAESHLRHESLSYSDRKVERVARERLSDIRETLTLRLDTFLSSHGGIVSELLEAMPSASPEAMAAAAAATRNAEEAEANVNSDLLSRGSVVAKGVATQFSNWMRTKVAPAATGWSWQADWFEAELRARIVGFTMEFLKTLIDQVNQLTEELTQITEELPTVSFQPQFEMRTKIPDGKIDPLKILDVGIQFHRKMIEVEAMPSRWGIHGTGASGRFVTLGARVASKFHSGVSLPQYRNEKFEQQATQFMTSLRNTWHPALLDSIRQAETYVQEEIIGTVANSLRIAQSELAQINSYRRYFDIEAVSKQLARIREHRELLEVEFRKEIHPFLGVQNTSTN